MNYQRRTYERREYGGKKESQDLKSVEAPGEYGGTASNGRIEFVHKEKTYTETSDKSKFDEASSSNSRRDRQTSKLDEKESKRGGMRFNRPRSGFRGTQNGYDDFR